MKLQSDYQELYMKRWLDTNRPGFGEVLVMFGFGLGVYVEALYSDKLFLGKAIIVDPDKSFFDELNREKDYSYIVGDARFEVVFPDFNTNILNDYLYSKLSSDADAKIKVAIYPNYHILYSKECEKFLATVDEAHDMVCAGKSVDERFSEAIQINISDNLNRLGDSLSIKAFASRVPKDIPIIIAASGPSLSKNVDVLKQAKGKAFIVGLDSSLPALLAAGVIPDIYVSIDPTKIARHFEDERIKDIPAVAVLQSPKHVIKDGQKHFFIFNGDEEVLPELKSKNVDILEVPALGSVANTAFYMMNLLGFKTIIFVGQDLAYTDDKYHADNTVHNEKTFKQDTVIMLPGIDGNNVKSSREFRMYKTGFEKVIEKFSDNTFIDATEGGAYINGTEISTLSEVINKYCNKEIGIQQYFNNVSRLIKEYEGNYEEKIYELSRRASENSDINAISEILSLVKCTPELEKSALYLFHQIRRLYFTNIIEKPREIYDLYESALIYWKNKYRDLLMPISKENRNKDKIVVITLNFLGNRHAPTKTALERIKVLVKDLGKEVLAINAREELTQVESVPFYNSVEPNVISEYNGIHEIEYEDFKFKMYQSSVVTPDYNEYGTILTTIASYAPYEVIVIGDNCILGDLCSEIIPTVCIPVVFSDIPFKPDSKQFCAITHSNFDNCLFDVNRVNREQYIESVFTFEMKKQTKKLSRIELGIPEDAFVTSIVGIRLHHDVSEDFLKHISVLFDKGVYFVFAGYFDNYKEYCSIIPGLAENSTFVGYQDDMLALQEICDLYVNPPRLGGGFSVVEAFYMHKPGVTLDYGDVAISAGKDFQVSSLDDMVETIIKYKNDKQFYQDMAEKAYQRSEILLDGKASLVNILSKMESSNLFF